MAYPVHVRPQVEGEIVEAMAWYEQRSPGLGLSFYRTYIEVLTVIAENPKLYRRVRGNVRRVILRRFPYALFYAVHDDRVVVLSCLHEKRSPERWPERS